MTTRSGRSEISGVADGRLIVRTKSAPVEGRANAEVTRLLASAFGVPPTSVSLKRGSRGRLKTFVIEKPTVFPAWAGDIDFS